MFINKKEDMMLEAVKIKLRLIDDVIEAITPEDRHGEIYECHVAQRVILKEVINELTAIKAGKAIVKGS